MQCGLWQGAIADLHLDGIFWKFSPKPSDKRLLVDVLGLDRVLEAGIASVARTIAHCVEKRFELVNGTSG